MAKRLILGAMCFGIGYNLYKSRDLNVPVEIIHRTVDVKTTFHELDLPLYKFHIFEDRFDLCDYFNIRGFRDQFDLDNKVRWYKINKLFTSNTILLNYFPNIFTSTDWINEPKSPRKLMRPGMDDLVVFGTSLDNKVVLVHNGPGRKPYSVKLFSINPNNDSKFKDSFSIPHYRDVYVAIVDDQTIVDKFIKNYCER